MTFGKRLQDFRTKTGYTRADVASLLGVSSVTIEKWELNQRRPTLDRSNKLAQLYGVTVDELVGDTLFNSDQKLKAAEVARILESGDENAKKQIRAKLQSAGYNDEKIDFFFNMASSLFQPPK